MFFFDVWCTAKQLYTFDSFLSYYIEYTQGALNDEEMQRTRKCRARQKAAV